MSMQQILPARYVDKQKLFSFLARHPDFKDVRCHFQVRDLLPGSAPQRDRCWGLELTRELQVKDDSYVLLVPRALTDVKLSAYYVYRSVNHWQAHRPRFSQSIMTRQFWGIWRRKQPEVPRQKVAKAQPTTLRRIFQVRLDLSASEVTVLDRHVEVVGFRKRNFK
jgi:hypothetical protein